MDFERFYDDRNLDSIKDKCRCYMYYDAILILDDGSMVNGIIQEVDDMNVGILVGEDMQVDEEDMNRQPNYGRNRHNRYRRFRRRNYPLGGINRVGLMPYPIYPVYPPFPYPYYPI